MNNLPITTSPAPTAAASKQASGTNDNADSSQPFGAVLARQTTGEAAGQAGGRATSQGTQGTTNDTDAQAATDVNAAEILARLGANLASGIGKDIVAAKQGAGALKTDTSDTKASDSTPADASPSAADMLAAVLAQAINPAATPAPITPATATKTDSQPITTAAPQDRSTIAKADARAPIQAGLAQKTEAEAKLAAQAETASFAAMREAAAPAQPTNTAMLASMQQAAAAMTTSVPQPAQATVSTPFNQVNWTDDFSQKITWLASSRQDQTAELHLNPPQLGPVDVVIKVSGDQATALFASPHAAVRDAIEQAMPKLRDMLADNGIMLGNTTVSDQTPRDQGQFSASQRMAPEPSGSAVGDVVAATASPVRVSPIARHNGIVDTFA